MLGRGARPNSGLKPGGATKVVAITISRMAPNTASFENARSPPDIGKDEADLSPRDHPDAHHKASEGDPGSRPPGRDVANDGE